MSSMSSLISRTFLIAGFAMTFAGAPAIAKEKAGKADERVPVGEPVSCITPSNIRSTHVIDDQTIDFEMAGGTVYRNALPYRCPGLGFEERFAYKLSTNQLCSVDIITVLHNFGAGGFSQGASCGLGQFQKMDKPGK